jgi:hypothetical protein
MSPSGNPAAGIAGWPRTVRSETVIACRWYKIEANTARGCALAEETDHAEIQNWAFDYGLGGPEYRQLPRRGHRGEGLVWKPFRISN